MIRVLHGDCRDGEIRSAGRAPRLCEQCKGNIARRGLKVKYCSLACRDVARKGKPISLEVLAKRRARIDAAGPKIREVATCRSCCWVWRPSTGRYVEACPRCGIPKDVRKRHVPVRNRERLAEYNRLNPGRSTKGTRATRRSVLLLVGNGDVHCVRCGCDNPSLLEVNHKDGGGAKEIKGRSQQFYRDITSLRRKTDDLELLCKPCNAVHALELKHGPLPFVVIWRAP